MFNKLKNAITIASLTGAISLIPTTYLPNAEASTIKVKPESTIEYVKQNVLNPPKKIISTITEGNDGIIAWKSQSKRDYLGLDTNGDGKIDKKILAKKTGNVAYVNLVEAVGKDIAAKLDFDNTDGKVTNFYILSKNGVNDASVTSKMKLNYSKRFFDVTTGKLAQKPEPEKITYVAPKIPIVTGSISSNNKSNQSSTLENRVYEKNDKPITQTQEYIKPRTQEPKKINIKPVQNNYSSIRQQSKKQAFSDYSANKPKIQKEIKPVFTNNTTVKNIQSIDSKVEKDYNKFKLNAGIGARYSESSGITPEYTVGITFPQKNEDSIITTLLFSYFHSGSGKQKNQTKIIDETTEAGIGTFRTLNNTNYKPSDLWGISSSILFGNKYVQAGPEVSYLQRKIKGNGTITETYNDTTGALIDRKDHDAGNINATQTGFGVGLNSLFNLYNNKLFLNGKVGYEFYNDKNINAPKINEKLDMPSSGFYGGLGITIRF